MATTQRDGAGGQAGASSAMPRHSARSEFRRPTISARDTFAILVGRALRVAARVRKSGGGTAVPGLIVNRIAPHLLVDTLTGFPEGLVIVTGSSGKSTTTKMLCALLEDGGMKVFTNYSTANISQGLMSSVLAHVDLRGHIDADIAVIEMDEAHGAKVARELAPRVVVLTNVMTDQIDRFNEPGRVADMLKTVASYATQVVVTNADDALLQERTVQLEGVKVLRYGVASQVLAETRHGLGNVKTSATRLTEGTLVASTSGARATVEHAGFSADIDLPARGVHFALDAAAAIAAASAILGESFDLGRARQVLGAVPPVFGRGEVVEVRGKLVEFVLVQNPASFQLNVDELPPNLEQVLVAMGSDVRDPSYLWPVDTHPLRHVSIVSGSLAEEVAMQLMYHDVEVDRVDNDLGHALDTFFGMPDPSSGVKTIIFSADSMRRTRTHLGLA